MKQQIDICTFCQFWLMLTLLVLLWLKCIFSNILKIVKTVLAIRFSVDKPGVLLSKRPAFKHVHLNLPIMFQLMYLFSSYCSKN